MPAMTGAQYLESLRDGRELYVRGEVVSNVPDHPAFQRTAQTLAGLFDLHHSDAYRDQLTYVSPTSGDRVAMHWLMPHSQGDLVRRRIANRIIAEQTYGMVSRTPNLVSQILVEWVMNPEPFARLGPQYPERLNAYYEYCREHDIVLTHAIVSPQFDRSKLVSEQEDPYLVAGMVDQTDEGIIVRGARMLATHTHFSHEVMVWPFERLTEKDERYALWFACPLNAKGLKLVSREPYDNGRTTFDSPFGSRFDEMDAMVIFDDVLIPWNRVFAIGNVQAGAGSTPGETNAGRPLRIFGAQQHTRAIVKAEFMYAVARAVTEAIGTSGFLHVQQALGEMLSYVDVFRGTEKLYETGVVEKDGKLYMAPDYTPGGTLLFPHMFTRMAWILRELCGAGQVMTPSAGDFNNPNLAPHLQRYFRGRPGVDAVHKTKLMKLAWELTSDQFGSRATLYEYFHSGDPVHNAARRHNTETSPLFDDLLTRALADMDESLVGPAALAKG